jgi:hypothetical protein
MFKKIIRIFSSFQYVMYIPGLTILLKIPLVMPCVSCYLDKIRGGWERKSATKKISVAQPLSDEKPYQSKDTFTINLPAQYPVPGRHGRTINVRST